MLQQILEMLAKLSGEEKASLFSTLAKDYEELPKDLEEKYLAKKNQKLKDKDAEILKLQEQVKNFETEDTNRKIKELENNIQNSISTFKVNDISKKDFDRAVRDALNNEANKEKDFETVVKEVLAENKHYTEVHKGSEGKIVFNDGEEGEEITEPKTSADLLAAAKKKKQ